MKETLFDISSSSPSSSSSSSSFVIRTHQYRCSGSCHSVASDESSSRSSAWLCSIIFRANGLQRLRGAELALPPYSEATTAGQLFNLLEQRRPRVNTISASEAHIHTRSCATPTTNSGSATSSRSSSHIVRPGTFCNRQGHGIAGRAPGS